MSFPGQSTNSCGITELQKMGNGAPVSTQNIIFSSGAQSDNEISFVEWKLSPSKTARKKFLADGSLHKNCKPEHLELRTMLEDPYVQNIIGYFAKRIKGSEVYMCWIDIHKFKSIKFDHIARRNKALFIYHTYIKLDASLFINEIDSFEREQIKNELDSCKDNPSLIPVGFYDKLQFRCFLTIYESIYIPFKLTAEYAELERQIKMKFKSARSMEDEELFANWDFVSPYAIENAHYANTVEGRHHHWLTTHCPAFSHTKCAHYARLFTTAGVMTSSKLFHYIQSTPNYLHSIGITEASDAQLIRSKLYADIADNINMSTAAKIDSVMAQYNAAEQAKRDIIAANKAVTDDIATKFTESRLMTSEDARSYALREEYRASQTKQEFRNKRHALYLESLQASRALYDRMSFAQHRLFSHHREKISLQRSTEYCTIASITDGVKACVAMRHLLLKIQLEIDRRSGRVGGFISEESYGATRFDKNVYGETDSEKDILDFIMRSSSGGSGGGSGSNNNYFSGSNNSHNSRSNDEIMLDEMYTTSGDKYSNSTSSENLMLITNTADIDNHNTATAATSSATMNNYNEKQQHKVKSFIGHNRPLSGNGNSYVECKHDNSTNGYDSSNNSHNNSHNSSRNNSNNNSHNSSHNNSHSYGRSEVKDSNTPPAEFTSSTTEHNTLFNLLQESVYVLHMVATLCRDNRHSEHNIDTLANNSVVKLWIALMSATYMFSYTFDHRAEYRNDHTANTPTAAGHLPPSYHCLSTPHTGLVAMKYLCRYNAYRHSVNVRNIYHFLTANTVEMLIEMIKFHINDSVVVQTALECLLLLTDTVQYHTEQITKLLCDHNNIIMLLMVLDKHSAAHGGTDTSLCNLHIQSIVVTLFSLVVRTITSVDHPYNVLLDSYHVQHTIPVVLSSIIQQCVAHIAQADDELHEQQIALVNKPTFTFSRHSLPVIANSIVSDNIDSNSADSADNSSSTRHGDKAATVVTVDPETAALNLQYLEIYIRTLSSVDSLFFDHTHVVITSSTEDGHAHKKLISQLMMKSINHNEILQFIATLFQHYYSSDKLLCQYLVTSIRNITYRNIDHKAECLRLGLVDDVIALLKFSVTNHYNSSSNNNNSNDGNNSNDFKSDHERAERRASIVECLLCLSGLVILQHDTTNTAMSMLYNDTHSRTTTSRKLHSEQRDQHDAPSTDIEKAKSSAQSTAVSITTAILDKGVTEIVMQILLDTLNCIENNTTNTSNITDHQQQHLPPDRSLLRAVLILLNKLTFKGLYATCYRLVKLGLCEKIIPLFKHYLHDTELYLLFINLFTGLAASHPNLVGAGKRLMKCGLCALLTEGMKGNCKVSGGRKWSHFNYPYNCRLCLSACHCVFHLTRDISGVEAANKLRKAGFQGMLMKSPKIVSKQPGSASSEVATSTNIATISTAVEETVEHKSSSGDEDRLFVVDEMSFQSPNYFPIKVQNSTAAAVHNEHSHSAPLLAPYPESDTHNEQTEPDISYNNSDSNVSGAAASCVLFESGKYNHNIEYLENISTVKEKNDIMSTLFDLFNIV